MYFCTVIERQFIFMIHSGKLLSSHCHASFRDVIDFALFQDIVKAIDLIVECSAFDLAL